LELAAARTKLLSPEALLQRLGDRLDLLKGTRDVDERHATLRATIAWSHDLLDADEQRLFRRMSVFRGGCTLETAEQVCDANLDTLASLLDKSLLRRRTGRLGEERFWMLETIRAFAAERLEESPDVAVVQRRHADRMLEVARSAHLTEEDDEPFQLPIVLAERDDMRAGLDWAAENDIELALELLVALENFWNLHATEEVLSRLDGLLGPGDEIPPTLKAGALRVRGGALHVLGSYELCDAPYEESLALCRDLGDERGVASLLQRLANSAAQRGALERARALIEESQKLAHERFSFIEVANYSLLAQIEVLTGDLEVGTDLHRRSADMAGKLHWHWWRAGQLSHVAWLAVERGDLDEAGRAGDEAVRLIRPDESSRGMFLALTALARAALARGHHRRAGLLWGAVEAENERAPNRAWHGRRTERAGPLLSERDPEFSAGVEQGRRLDFWDSVAIALGELEPPQTVP
jgi:tetratricopeptide (TPR) repeat protein